MNDRDRVAVTSRSFSRNPVLRDELCRRYKHVTFNEEGRRLEGGALVDYLRGHSKAITALERLDDFVLTRLPELKVIGKYGVGLDMIDLEAMRRHRKRLGWIPGVNRRSAAELTLTLILCSLRHVVAANREVVSGDWRQHMGNELTGKTVGIIGCGNIGKDLTLLLEPFRCHILVNDIRRYEDFYAAHSIEAISLNELLERADIVTLHVPLDESTRGMITEERLRLMRPTSVLINAARGGLVDEVALKRSLLDKKLAAAAFDVFDEEPPQDRELVQLPNFLATPHIGGSAEEAVLAMGRAAIEGLDKNAVP